MRMLRTTLGKALLVFSLCFGLTAGAQAQFDAQGTAVLIQIKQLLENMASYYGINFSGGTPSAATPDLSDTNAISNVLYSLPAYAGKTLLLAGSESFRLNSSDQLSADSYKWNQIKATVDQINKWQTTLTLDSVLGPATYQPIAPDDSSVFSSGGDSDKPTNQSQVALKYIQNLTGTSTPLKFDEKTMAEKFINADEAKRRQYAVLLHNYAASLNLGLSNLKMLYTNRLPQPGLSGSLENKSKLEVSLMGAQRRMSGDWHSKIERASSMNVQRETLYVLAELNYNLMQMRLMQERLLATVSAYQVSAANLSPPELD